MVVQHGVMYLEMGILLAKTFPEAQQGVPELCNMLCYVFVSLFCHRSGKPPPGFHFWLKSLQFQGRFCCLCNLCLLDADVFKSLAGC